MDSTPHLLRAPDWHPNERCWLAWPISQEEWGQHLDGARNEFIELCRAIAGDAQSPRPDAERLEILVPDQATEDDVRNRLGSIPAVIHQVEYGDVWLRDTGPLVVDCGGARQCRCFRTNGWGGKFDIPGDEGVNARIADLAGLPRLELDWILEGGAIELDGRGTAITTEQCLLNKNRNPEMGRRDLEQALARDLGIRHVIWLRRGLLGDHTDGHVDNVARFLRPGHVICATPAGDDDPNSEILAEIRHDLGLAHDAEGNALSVHSLPSPGRMVDDVGAPMPANYLNFYIGNEVVVVPAYGVSADTEAVKTLSGHFPNRRVIGVMATATLHGGGAFHCMTQPLPRLAIP